MDMTEEVVTRRPAKVVGKQGAYPIGGMVNGRCQKKAHDDKKNRVSGHVVIVEEGEMEVSTYGDFYKGETLPVVRLEGKDGWFLKDLIKDAPLSV